MLLRGWLQEDRAGTRRQIRGLHVRHALLNHVHFFVVVDLEDSYRVTCVLRLRLRLIRCILLKLIHKSDLPVLLGQIGPVARHCEFGTRDAIHKGIAVLLYHAFSLPASIKCLHQRHQGLISVIQKIRVIISLIMLALVPKALNLGFLRLLSILIVLQLIILINRDLCRPVHLECEHQRCSLLRDKHFGFLNQNIENGVVANGFVHERNVDLCWQALIDLDELCFDKLLFFFFRSIFEDVIGQVSQSLDEARRRQVRIYVVFALLLVGLDIGLDR